MKTRFFYLLLALLTLTTGVAAKEVNKKPFVIPELKEWKGSAGEFTLSTETQIAVPKGDVEVKRIALEFANDIETLLGFPVTVVEGKAGANSISLGLKKDKKLGKEGYQIAIANKVTITAPESIGLYWATRTILQMAEQNDKHELAKGVIRDFPSFPLRGFMLDCGRKFIPIEFLRDYVKYMAYYKMNTFQIHLNDNGFKQFFQDDWSKTYSAFRLESDTYPGLAAEDGHYTKAEFRDLQKLAESMYVNIIPEIDVPAHSLAFSQYMPEIGSEEYGMDHLDLFAPETYKFIDGLFHEYLEGDDPVFRGEYVHVGTDEYSNKDPKVVEKFRYFTDYCIKLVEKYNKKAAVWGALTHAKGETPVKSDDVLMLAWHNPYAQPDDMIEQGYDLVSIPDGLVYIVPKAGYYYDYLNNKYLYEEWTPANIGGKIFENNPKVRGGMFAVWNDHPGNGISTKDIHHRVHPSMQALATKMWTGNQTSLPFETFDELRQNLSEAPGVNQLGRVGKEPAKVLSVAKVSPLATTGLTEIGYDYTVSFDVKGKKEEFGAVLFSSPTAKFYLSDPIKGMLGFSRDGYLNTFNYKIKEGQQVKITIQGNNEVTRLYVNGKLKEELNVRTMEFRGGKDKMYYISTLVFPLEKAGQFKSSIENLNVFNYWVNK